MHPALLYAVTVIVWSTSWFAITFQLGEVSPIVSVGYRFFIAGLLIFAWCRMRGLPLAFTPHQHVFMALQGLVLYSLSYIGTYTATGYITSGLVAVCFALITLINICNQAIFFRIRVKPVVALGCLLGIAGIGFVFWPEIKMMQNSRDALYGIGAALAGAYFASLGNMISLRNSRDGMPVLSGNSYAMVYGGLFSLALAPLLGLDYSFEWSAGYIGSMLYLAVFASVIAFGSYLTLVAKMGPDRASYVAVLFPVLALVISTFFEGYVWTPKALIGLGLIVGGNILVQMTSDHIKLAQYREFFKNKKT